MSAFKIEGGKQYQQIIGTRRQVFNGTAKKTGYGKSALTKKNLKKNKHGRIVSIKKSRASRKNKNLGKFLRKRGSKTFGPVLAKGGKKMKGGLFDSEFVKEFKKDLKDAQDKQKLLNEAYTNYFKKVKPKDEHEDEHEDENEETKTAREEKEKAQTNFDEANNKVQKYEVFKIKNADGFECDVGFEKYQGIVLKDNQNQDSCTGWEVVTPSRFQISIGMSNTHYLRKKE